MGYGLDITHTPPPPKATSPMRSLTPALYSNQLDCTNRLRASLYVHTCCALRMQIPKKKKKKKKPPDPRNPYSPTFRAFFVFYFFAFFCCFVFLYFFFLFLFFSFFFFLSSYNVDASMAQGRDQGSSTFSKRR
jgi:hypothetical protein